MRREECSRSPPQLRDHNRREAKTRVVSIRARGWMWSIFHAASVWRVCVARVSAIRFGRLIEASFVPWADRNNEKVENRIRVTEPICSVSIWKTNRAEGNKWKFVDFEQCLSESGARRSRVQWSKLLDWMVCSCHKTAIGR